MVCADTSFVCRTAGIFSSGYDLLCIGKTLKLFTVGIDGCAIGVGKPFCRVESRWRTPMCQGRSDGGISVFMPPKSAQVNFLWGKNDVRTAIQQFYTPKKLLYPRPKKKILATPLRCVHNSQLIGMATVSTSLNKFANSEVELCRVGGVNAPVGSRDPGYNFLCC